MGLISRKSSFAEWNINNPDIPDVCLIQSDDELKFKGFTKNTNFIKTD